MSHDALSQEEISALFSAEQAGATGDDASLLAVLRSFLEQGWEAAAELLQAEARPAGWRLQRQSFAAALQAWGEGIAVAAPLSGDAAGTVLTAVDPDLGAALAGLMLDSEVDDPTAAPVPAALAEVLGRVCVAGVRGWEALLGAAPAAAPGAAAALGAEASVAGVAAAAPVAAVAYELTVGEQTGRALLVVTGAVLEKLTAAGGPPVAAASQAPPQEAPQPEPAAAPFQFRDLDPGEQSSESRNIDLILDVTLAITVELGRTRRQIREVLALGPGSVVELDRLAGEDVDVLANGILIAKGEVVVIDENFGVRITDIVSPAARLSTLR